MIRGYSSITQAFLGTLFTWGLTGAGAGLVFFFSSKQQKILDGSLGFAAGVMIAASYWSLLKPAIEIAESSSKYGTDGEFVFLPVGFGFFLGALFVFLADIYLPVSAISAPKLVTIPITETHLKMNGLSVKKDDFTSTVYHIDQNGYSLPNGIHRRQRNPQNFNSHVDVDQRASQSQLEMRWRRVLLLIIAITVHNIPEGLAVGVGFGAINKTESATFESARNLALGIGIQNFPEGLAVSLPLCGAGMSSWKSFWYGQMSGLVEPLAGLLGCFAVTLAEPLLPYALSFAAGAMIYVVVDDIIPEAQVKEGGWKTSSRCRFTSHETLGAALLGYDCINERFLTAKFKTKIKDLNVICCYAPTEDSDEKGVLGPFGTGSSNGIGNISYSGNSKLASWLTIVGFLVMMTLDVGLG